jgi:hypothetical protein
MVEGALAVSLDQAPIFRRDLSQRKILRLPIAGKVFLMHTLAILIGVWLVASALISISSEDWWD